MGQLILVEDLPILGVAIVGCHQPQLAAQQLHIFRREVIISTLRMPPHVSLVRHPRRDDMPARLGTMQAALSDRYFGGVASRSRTCIATRNLGLLMFFRTCNRHFPRDSHAPHP
jgi:hypothetical protein